MAKTKFNIITSTCVPLPLENVDTDQIIPARFLKATTREEKFFGDNLFRDWRYNADGSLNKDFVLNDPTYSGQILVAGKNFGSGSSREHAALAPRHLGIRAVIAKSLARIHRANLVNFGILPLILVDKGDYERLEQGGNVTIPVADIIAGGECAVALADGGSVRVRNDLTVDELEIIRAGGLLNYVRNARTRG